MIGIFDSGIGGLSIFFEIKKILPKTSLIYLADSKNCPYALKSKKEIDRIVFKNTQFLLNEGAKIIVMACNTASCTSLDFLRRKFKIPIVGVVPMIKEALRLSKSGKIGIIGTERTVKSEAYQNLVKKFCQKKKVFSKSCPGLAENIEKGNLRKSKKLIKKYLNPLLKEKIDILGLGCTHYILIKNEIEKEVGEKVMILDSNKAVAKRVKELWQKEREKEPSPRQLYKFFTTGNPFETKKVVKKLLNYEINDIKKIRI